MIIFSGWQFFSSFLSRVPPFFFNHFRFHSAGINSSPDSSHFVRHHADDYLWREQPKNLFLPLFAAPHPWEEEFLSTGWGVSTCFVANWSAAETIWCISWSKYSSKIFFPKPFSTFMCQSCSHRLVTVIASGSICPRNLFPLNVLNFILYQLLSSFYFILHCVLC